MRALILSVLTVIALAACRHPASECEYARETKFSCGDIAEFVLTGERCMIVSWWHHSPCMRRSHKHFTGEYNVRMMDNSTRKVSEYEIRVLEHRDFETWDPETGTYK